MCPHAHTHTGPFPKHPVKSNIYLHSKTVISENKKTPGGISEMNTIRPNPVCLLLQALKEKALASRGGMTQQKSNTDIMSITHLEP